jgi:hypothetical protein
MEALKPGKKRHCTDLLCTLLFLFFWGGMIVISVNAFRTGDPDRLLYGLDYKFDQCNRDNSAAARGLSSLTQEVALTNGSGTKPIRLGGRDHSSAPLYYVVGAGRPRFASSYIGVCADACPNAGLTTIGFKPDQWVCTGRYYLQSNRPQLSDPRIPMLKTFTKDAVKAFVSDFEAFRDSGQSDAIAQLKEARDFLGSFFLFKGPRSCPDDAEIGDPECAICYPSYPTVRYGSSSFCLPDLSYIADNKDEVAAILASNKFDLGVISDSVNTLIGTGGATTVRITADAYAAYPIILACIAFSVILGFVWALLLRKFVRPMVVITLIGVLAALAIGGWTLFDKAVTMRASPLYGVDDSYTAYSDVTMAFFAADATLFALYVLFILCFGSRILLACGVIVEASKAITAMPQLLLVPVLPAMLTFGLFVYFLIGGFFIVSSGQLKLDGSGVAQIVYDDNLKGALAYHFFGCVWTSVLLNHIGWAIIGLAVAQWYFARDKRDGLGSRPVTTAAYRVLWYHFGSVVFGSLVVAIVRYIRYMMNFLKRSVKASGDGSKCFSRIVDCVFCCVECCLRCFESLLEFISRNAYIMLAIESGSFCTSAKSAFGYLASNMGGLAMVQAIGDLFLFFGKVFIGMMSAGICAIVLTQTAYYQERVSSIILPCMIVLVGAYLVGSLFMGIFEMAIDTIFLSFCVDEDKKLGFADGPLKAFVAEAGAQKTNKLDPNGVAKVAPKVGH